MTLRVGSLFAGIGGMDLGLEWAGMEVAWQCEIDPFCRLVLEKHWPDVKRYTDVRTILDEQPEAVDVIAGGPPCQPASVAGKRKGKDDDRWLWPETLRAVATLRPTWCLFENPPGILTMGLDQVFSELEGYGYACWPTIVPACAVGAAHQRDRVWIIAHANGLGCDKANSTPSGEFFCDCDWERSAQKSCGNELKPWSGGNASAAAHSCGNGLEGSLQARNGEPKSSRIKAWGEVARNADQVGASHWAPEPGLARLVPGVPSGMERSRIQALGNAVVPQVVHEIGRAIMAAHMAAIQGKPGDIATRTIQK